LGVFFVLFFILGGKEGGDARARYMFLGESEGGRWGGLEDEGVSCTVARGKVWNDKGG